MKLTYQVISRLTPNVTHIIYKSGLPSTLTWWRKQDEDDRPHVVGVGWLTHCKKAGERLDEGKYRVAVEEEDVFQKVSRNRNIVQGNKADGKRRKSMEPKSLLGASMSRPAILLSMSCFLCSVSRDSCISQLISSILWSILRQYGSQEELDVCS